MSKNVRWNPGKDPIPIINDAAQRGVGLAAEHVLGEARKQVPHEEGTLERSGRAANELNGNVARAAVGFDTEYAIDQHESMHYRHKKGRKAKYLEDPLNSSKGTIREIVAAAIRKQL
ncbi:hypothetical protein [Brevibacterium aurantiacum]|uniref:hypothetical protein n=1 Tax=Brevibacterium aurantiacum TaxID=273384 RepID=UPI000050FBA1|nr:hypothetical protein [Brevibacterium aurantiacum]